MKNKTLIFITLILILFSSSILYVFNSDQDEKIIVTKEKYNEDIKIIYKNIVDKYDKLYTSTKLNEHTSLDIKEALTVKDRNKLYKLSLMKYRRLVRENSDLVVMSYYDSENKLFLNMASPDSEKINNHFKFPKRVYEKGKTFKAFTNTNGKVLFSIIHPIFYKEDYIGAIELGVDIQYILKEMLHYSKVEGVILVKDSNKFVVKYKTLKNMNLFTNQVSIRNLNTVKSIRDLSYATYLFEIKNHANMVIAKVEFFKDISFVIDGHKKNIFNIIIFLVILIILALFAINFGLNRGIRNLEEKYKDASEYRHMINAHVMLVNTGLDEKIIEVSHRFCEVSGYTASELIGTKCSIFTTLSMEEGLYKKVLSALKEDGVWNGELKKQTKSGTDYWVNLTIQAVIEDEKIVEYHSIMHNITDKKLKEELVIVDGLTNIYNRRHFDEIFPRMAKSIKREGGCFNFILLDIDHFKQFNDVYGHAHGDVALISVADVLKASLHRPDDFCFRLGGEEFGILYKTANEEDGYLFAQKIRKNIQSLNIDHSGSPVHKVLTASFGLVSLRSDHIIDYKEIYKLADGYLYRAKDDGRNKVVSKLV